MDEQVLQVLRLNFVLLVGMLCGVANAQFAIEPESVVQAKGLEAVFECLSPGAFAYSWSVDGVGFLDPEFPPEVKETGGSSGNPSMLTIPGSSQFNNSVVQCLVFPQSGSIAFSRNTTLTVEQVTVDVINGDDEITISVTNTFTTDLAYRVDVTRMTLSSTESILTIYNMEKQFNFNHNNRSVCDTFSFTVTPTAMEVEGRPSEPATGFFTTVTGGDITPLISQGKDLMRKTVTLSDMVPICTNFTSFTVHANPGILPEPISETIEDSRVINFTLPTDIRIDITVTLTSSIGVDLIYRNIIFKTTDIQEVQTSECPEGGGIDMKPVYVDGSLSLGALVCVLPVGSDGTLVFQNMKLVTIPRNSSSDCTLPDLPGGEYRVVAFDLETNNRPGEPMSIAADSDVIFVTSDKEETTSPPPNSEGITVTVLSSGGVQVTCPESLNCLALLQSSNTLDRKHVGFIDSSATSTIISLDTLSDDDYVVVYSWDSEQSIFDGKVALITSLDSPTTISTTATTSDQLNPPITDIGGVQEFPAGAIIAGITVVAVLLLILIGAAVILFWRVKKHYSKVEIPESDRRVDWSSTLAGIEQPNEAYAISAMLKKNIAYEQTNTPAQRQRMDNSPVLTEGGEYENIQPDHQYEEVLPHSHSNTPGEYVNVVVQ